MDRQTKNTIQTFLPALVRQPPHITQNLELLCRALLCIMRLPPDPMLDIRNRLFAYDEESYSGRNVFRSLSEHRYQFFEMTGETPETFLQLVPFLHIRTSHAHSLSPQNRILLVLLWLRCYNTYHMLSALFNVCVSTIQDEIRTLIPVFYLKLKTYITWPTVEQWRNMKHTWKNLECAVGAIDGTSHEICRPSNEPQQLFYSGHRKYHSIHSQVIVDNCGQIRYIECGFMGHLNDAQQFALMPKLGTDLPFPDECIILADKIYPNRHPIVTPYSAAQIRQRNAHQRRQSRRLNRIIQRYRICVEHAIAELKVYRAVGTVWRHRRRALPRVVTICAGLVCRKKQIGLIM